ncbi:MAG TPA: hypothetical protein DDW76_23760 [Cyanobacteria bacterium UBA11369]|nr:hypothetical protein [Cyanobacteria bacterium UBA11371]HBE30827.1 hypothetical protein [Cyanobacteria bacterium UBA11368]HBE51707.1 hypothetical protein [Cyanobacteria bacterium UBA11369]
MPRARWCVKLRDRALRSHFEACGFWVYLSAKSKNGVYCQQLSQWFSRDGQIIQNQIAAGIALSVYHPWM